MSLKAKIEAVIYASEEPVTLAQLAGVLGQEAQAELDRADSAQQSLSLNEVFPEETEVSTEQPVADTEAPPAEASSAISEVTPAESAQETPAEATPETKAEDSAAADAAAAARREKDKASRLRGYLRSVLEELVVEYAVSDRGLEIREIAGGYRFATKPEYHDAVRGFVKSLKPPLKLTLQALETLAVVAYKQPVTAPEISEIRGVDSAGVLGSLITRKLITTAGRKQVIGRPILYKTTKEFLVKFGLKDVAELPSIEEFEKMAGQMAEQEEIPMADGPGENEPAAERRASEGEEQSSDLVADEVIVDGRISGLPPRYDDSDDPSAIEAAEMQGTEDA